jgi:hypothetical protein
MIVGMMIHHGGSAASCIFFLFLLLVALFVVVGVAKALNLRVLCESLDFRDRRMRN